MSDDDEIQFNFDDDEFLIPDSAAELIAGWEEDEAVLAAVKEVVEAEAEKVSVETNTAELQNSQTQLQRQIDDLMNQLNLAKKAKANVDSELFKIRSRRIKAEQRVEAAKAKVRVTKDNAEKRKEFKAQRDQVLAEAERFAWYQGVTTGDGKTLKIMPHQMEGALFLTVGRRAVEADKMGVGKTLTAIAAIDLMKAKRILIVTPADVASNFLAEVRQWSPNRVPIVLTGMPKAQRDAMMNMLKMMDEFTVIVNYEAWRKDSSLLDKFIQAQFDTVIMDEAHTMKALRSDAYKGMRHVIMAANSCPKCGNYVNHMLTDQDCECGWVYSRTVDYEDPETGIDVRCSVKNVIPMTGTPILNSPEDLFPLLHLIDPKNFYNVHRFLDMYAQMNYYNNKWEFRTGGMDSLMKQLSGKFISRSMEDAGVILPEQKPIIHELTMSPEDYPDQWRVMEQIRRHAAVILSSGKALPIPAQIALITRQRQANVWPAGIKMKDAEGNIVFDAGEEVNESIKIDKTMEMLHEFVDGGERVAVFSQFATGLEQLEERCKREGIKAVRFDGSTPHALKEEIKANFNKSRGEESKWDVILANYKTGGVGLNLTVCTQMIILDEEWNPGKRDQAYARIARIGQDQRTFVHILQLTPSIDSWMHALIANKEDMIQGFEQRQQDMQSMYLEALKNGEV